MLGLLTHSVSGSHRPCSPGPQRPGDLVKNGLTSTWGHLNRPLGALGVRHGSPSRRIDRWVTMAFFNRLLRRWPDHRANWPRGCSDWHCARTCPSASIHRCRAAKACFVVTVASSWSLPSFGAAELASVRLPLRRVAGGESGLTPAESAPVIAGGGLGPLSRLVDKLT